MEPEKIFDLKYGVSGVVVMLALHFFMKLIEILWKLKEKKDSASETAINALAKSVQDNTAASIALEKRLVALEITFAAFPKLKEDLRRSYVAIKYLAGDQWEVIYKKLKRDEEELL